MRIGNKTIEKLVSVINEETQYRSGPDLVRLFNSLGADDRYGKGFPARKDYTRANIDRLNGTAGIDECLKRIFDPSEFIEAPQKLNECLVAFNKYLSFDGWNVILQGREISFCRVTPSMTPFKRDAPVQVIKHKEEVDEFLRREFAEIKLERIISDEAFRKIIAERLEELRKCLDNQIPLAAVLLAGSVLEGVLLALALAKSQMFVTAAAAPKKDGRVMPIGGWYLSGLLDVAKELGYIQENIWKFCGVVRDYRNYIHPYQQRHVNVTIDIQTAKVCFQVVKGVISQVQQRLEADGVVL